MRWGGKLLSETSFAPPRLCICLVILRFDTGSLGRLLWCRESGEVDILKMVSRGQIAFASNNSGTWMGHEQKWRERMQ